MSAKKKQEVTVRSALTGLAIFLVVSALIWGLSQFAPDISGKSEKDDTTAKPGTSQPAGDTSSDSSKFWSQLDGLVVSKPLPATGYSDKAFKWAGKTDPQDKDQPAPVGVSRIPEKCNTKDVIRVRDAVTLNWTDESKCKFTGTWIDGYGWDKDGAITYQSGDDASKFDIEHIVARSNAWISGASKWTAAERERFANDPLELVVAGASPNRSKGDQAADTYIPIGNYRCEYINRQVKIKDKYNLTVTQMEKDNMIKVGTECAF